jgi:hypothetical protein
MRCWRLLLHVELSEHLGVIVGVRESLTHAILDPICSRGHLLDRVVQVLDKPQCMLRVVRMNLRGSARTLRFHNHTHRSSFTMPNTDAPTSSQALHRDGKQRRSLAALLKSSCPMTADAPGGDGRLIAVLNRRLFIADSHILSRLDANHRGAGSGILDGGFTLKSGFGPVVDVALAGDVARRHAVVR